MMFGFLNAGPGPDTGMDPIRETLFPSRGDWETVDIAGGFVAVDRNHGSAARAKGYCAVLVGHAALGADGAGRVDAKRLIDLYRQHGTGLSQSLHGSFCYALVDEKARLCQMAVDRMGVYPLCWATTRDRGVGFASTATALTAHPAIDATIDAQAIYDYLYAHVIPSPGTIYAAVHKVPPGHQVEVNAGHAALQAYWRPHFEPKTSKTLTELQQQLREQLRLSVAQMSANGPTGAFLSGGLDSSTVAGLLHDLHGSPATCFTIGFEKQGFDELEYARCAAHHFGNDLVHYYVTPDDVLQTIPEIAHTYDEPFGNSSAVPALICARLARDHGIKTLLAGDGGDELFAGNERYRKQLLFNWYRKMPGPLQVALDRLARGTATPQARGLSRIGYYLAKARANLPDRIYLANFLNLAGVNNVFTATFLERVDVEQPRDEMNNWYNSTPECSELQRMLYLDWKITLADNDLRKVTRMCQLAGVEVCFPFLADTIVEFSQGLDQSQLMPKLKLRHFFRETVRGYLPEKIINKPKHGFGMPIGLWLLEHNALQKIAYDSLAQLAERKILLPDFVPLIIRQHKNEHANYYGAQIWVLMMLEQWLQRHAPELIF